MRAVVPVCSLLAVSVLVSAPATAETVKARVLDVEERKNEVRVDVAGQSRTYRVDDRSLYRVLRRGRLVVITAERVDGRHTIVDARSAAQEGRVSSVDERRGRATIRDTDTGRSEDYYFEDGPPRGLRPGDVISFDVEERSRRLVITRWRRIGGGRDDRDDRDDRTTLTVLRDSGEVTDVDRRRGQVTVELSSSRRRQTFDVPDRRLLDDLRRGDRVSFEYERRFVGRPVITSMR
jgi:Cu/Ag efflux protein CusF